MGNNHKQRSYKLMPQARQILALYRTESSKPSDYIFPLLDSGAAYARSADIDTMPVDLKKALFNQVYSKNAMLNKCLKQVAQDAGIDKPISFHISRHTFASIAREKGISSKIVQEALAHSSLTTTERYLHSFGSEEVGKALQGVFSGAPSSETKKEERKVISVSPKVLARMKELGLLDED
jgi:integrase